MNAAIFIAGRELRERSRLLLIATVLAVIPFVASLTLRDHRNTGMAMTATFLAVGYAAVVALMLGISATGRELAENRGSFLFAKPVSPASIWFGKTAAALVICLGAFLIVALPTYTLARDGWRDLWGRSELGALYAVILCVAMFFGGHVASTMLRSRSARVLLDVAFLLVAAIALFAILRPLVAAGGGAVATKVLIAIGIALLAVFLAAPVWQLARGRVDPVRNHLALSTVLWSAVAVILVVAGAYVSWVMSPPLSSVTYVFGLDQSPSGEWAFISGIAPDRGTFMASYLINTKTGESERLTLPVTTDVQFSAGGKIAAWFENDTLLPRFTAPGPEARDMFEAADENYGKGRFRLYTRRLEPNAKAVATPIALPLPRTVRLSHDGSRVTLDGQQYDVATGRSLGAVEPVKPSRDDWVVGEVGELRLLMLTPDRQKMQIVDRVTRKVEVEVTGVTTPKIGRTHPTVPRYTENATFIGFDRNRQLVLWDAKTGAKRAL